MLSPSTATEAAATIIALTAYGVTKIQEEYREHEEKKLSDSMIAIDQIYNESLKNMLVEGIGENSQISTPPIFIMDTKNPDKPIKSLVLNSQILQDLSETYPAVNSDLLAYGERIHNAMMALRQFYFLRTKKRDRLHRGKQTDLTSSVLSYLILMISTHCYKFEGIETTLTYLRGFQKFAQRFGSYGNKKTHSDHYQHMSMVYSELNIAESLLYQYSLTLSFTNYLTLLIPRVANYSNELMRCAVRMITPTEYWDQIEFITAENIQEGIIKKNYDYAHEGLFGGKEIAIIDSPMKEKLKVCAKNYFTAIRINDDPENKAAFVTDDYFSPHFEPLQWVHIMDVARKSDNFFTVKIKPSTHESLGSWLTRNDKFLTHRIKMYQDLLGLINKMNVLMYYCAHLSNRVKQLGEIYITNPHHCVYIFEIFHAFGSLLDNHVKDLTASTLNINKENGTRMPLVPSQNVYEKLISIYRDVRANILPLINYIYEKHKEHPKTITADFNRAIKENVSQMITIAKRVADQYDIHTALSEQVKYEPSPTAQTTPPHYLDIKETPPQLRRTISQPLAIPANLAKPIRVIAESKPLVITPQESIEQKDEKTAAYNEDTINKIGMRIHYLNTIDANQAHLYTKIYDAILDFRQKAVTLRIEDSLRRRVKGQKMEGLLNGICGAFMTYLNQERDQRIATAEDFTRNIIGDLQDIRAAYLDEQKNAYAFWNTHSRRLANKLVSRCNHLAQINRSLASR